MSWHAYTAAKNLAEGAAAWRMGEASFIPFLLPADAVRLPGTAMRRLLEERLGPELLHRAFQPDQTIASPLEGVQDTAWLKTVNMAGVNVRTIHSFWNVVKYALTLPYSQSAIHLLPIWEPGVVASLYGMASWRINPEFFSPELYWIAPHLDTVEKQLKVVVNLLHALGKTVGMDVIPHTDRYSEIVLANPAYFEWLRRRDLRITDHRSHLHEEAEEVIYDTLRRLGPAVAGLPLPEDSAALFDEARTDEATRLALLFGEHRAYHGRNVRRDAFINALFAEGLEPVPATMAPPYRGLVVDPDPLAKTVDEEGRVWRDYRIAEPQPMSRVFGPLTRFKLYERLDDNQHWAIDFERPRKAVWDYFCARYADIQRAYHFDFMRGDMSHVQMRPDGVPDVVDAYYDPHKAVKAHIGREVPYFGYFAETFLAEPGVMAYGDEVAHLLRSDADSTLGDLQSMVVGSAEFMGHLQRYHALLRSGATAPNFTIMTGDKDDPRFDGFYLRGNEARFFIGLFLSDMPAYMALGFECRDPHPEPAPNEHYTKLYVFHLDEGPKSTKGHYQWGQNRLLFERVNRMRQFSEALRPQGLHGLPVAWLLPPSAEGEAVIAWTQADAPRFVFVANLSVQDVAAVHVPFFADGSVEWRGVFSTHREAYASSLVPGDAGGGFMVDVEAGEGLCFEVG